ncbi:MAG: hypothetical protein ABL958_02315 [Bdellovibrionia bacterium]
MENITTKNRDGDEISYLGRRESDRPKRLDRSNTLLLWMKMLNRYYLSFTVRKGLLSNQYRAEMSYGKDQLDQLLSIQQVSNVRFPKLLPGKAEHEDYHLRKLEFDSSNRWEKTYEKSDRPQDLQDLKVPSGVSYKFQGHGDSQKQDTEWNFAYAIGRRSISEHPCHDF